MDKLHEEREPNLRDYAVPIAVIGIASVGGAIFLSENIGNFTHDVYDTAREIFYFLLSNPYYLR